MAVKRGELGTITMNQTKTEKKAMKRTIRVSASFGGKISTGSWENMSPNFSAEETFEVEGDSLQVIDKRQKELHDLCYRQFQDVAHKATVERIEKEFKNIRFYTAPNGKKYPSVTSIRDFDSAFFISDADLYEYAAQGNINDIRVKHFIKTGQWIEPMKLEACWPHCHTLKTGNLNLSLDCGDFPGFLAKYPIAEMVVGEPVFNNEYEYAGEPDFIGIPKFKEAEPIKSVCDVKRSVDKLKAFVQMAAYAKCLDLKQMVIVPLNESTEQKFSKPIVSRDVDGYFEMFLNKRKAFRKRYGI